MVREVNGLNELKEVVNNNKKVVVDLWAPWCGPCKMLGPVVEKVSNEVSDTVFYKVNIDDNEDIAYTYNVEAIPTLLVFENGALKDRSVGFVQENRIKELVK